MRAMQLNGTSAIVTGGASGLGAGTVRVPSALGVRCFVFDRNEAGAKEVAAQVGGVGIGGDVTDPGDCQRAVDEAAAAGNLRIAVNCAGTGWVGRVVNRDGTPHDLNAFQTILQINTIGTFNVMTRAAAAMATTEPLQDGERGRDRQHGFGRCVRRTDRSACIFSLEGGRGRDDASCGA